MPTSAARSRAATAIRSDLAHPRSFSEKICWRKIYDRDPLLPRVVDKYLARKYVIETLGERRDAARVRAALRNQGARKDPVSRVLR